MALLEHLGIGRGVWGGVSMGGFQSLRAALTHPDSVGGLILIDTQAGAENPDLSPMYEAAAAVAMESGWNEDISDLAAGILFGASATEEVRAPWMDWWKAQPTHSAGALIRAVTRREDITDRLGAIAAPAVVIHGEEDAAIPMERAEALAAGLPEIIEFARIPKAGHSSTLEQPAAVTAVLERFLGSVTAGTAA